MTADEVRIVLAQQCADAGSQHAWAKAHGLSPAYVGDVLSGRRDLGDRILAQMGYERLVMYRRTVTGV